MTQLIDLGKLRFHFAGDWASSTQYESNDIVKYGGNVYVYTYALKSAGVLPTDASRWALMVEGFNFQGEFSTSTNYKIGDTIAHGGVVYVAILDSFNITPPNATYWSRFLDGIQYEGEYSSVASYQKNDIVKYGASVYIAKQDTTNNLPTNTTFWDRFVEGIGAEGVYNEATNYVPNDLVAYGANIYRAKIETVNNPPNNTTYWELYVGGIKFLGEYSGITEYYVNDLVSYGNIIYRARQTTTGNLPTDNTKWELLVGGTAYKGLYNNATTYYNGDLVNYGGNVYIANGLTVGNLPTDTANWSSYVSGFSYKGVWSSTTVYYINDAVTYGGSLYSAIVDNTNTDPTDTIKWNKLAAGIKSSGPWTTATEYATEEIVTYGGNTYISMLPHASNDFNTDLAAGRWQKFNSGIRWTGPWTSSTQYYKDDIVKSGGSAYIAKIDHVSNDTAFNTDYVADRWEEFAIGGADVIPPFDGDNVGQSLSVLANGSDYGWLGATASDKVFYVAPHGQDIATAGRNLSTPFASIKYACEQSGPNATIFVKTGTFTEELPIIVPANTAIVGDNQRTTIVQPAAGFETGTMWKLSNGAILNKMTFRGMTGWVPGSTASDITTSTPAGIAVAFNEASPITTKSPYVLECSFIGVGGIGVYVDGTAHATGNRSMIFHGYTIISDNGIGYWVDNGGLAELVSNFTYYCTFGYTCTNGAKIRSLNGNCSYGLYGATSQGFDATETPITGTLVGEQLNAVYVSGTVNVGDTITDDVTGATATILNVQYSADKVYIENRVGDFGQGNNCTTSTGAVFTVDFGANENVDGFILIATGLAETPRPGGSISLAGDSISYVIQSVSGTYVDNTSRMVIVLSQEKPTGSAPGTALTIRYRYSEVRLTGHDFLLIGTGGVVTTNHPGIPTQPPAQGNEVVETFPGRVYYVSTDQSGNFRVGEFFRIDQATGTATLNANAFNLAGLTSLRLGSIGAQLGESINEFSSDPTLAGNSNLAVPTEFAVKTYVDTALGTVDPSSILLETIYTAPFDDTNTTFDADGNLSGAIQGNVTYSLVTWEEVGAYTVLPPGITDIGSYYRLKSWREYNSTTNITRAVTVNYSTTTNLVTTITVAVI